MINANDGGANISFNGGQSWSTQKNQPTAQFYRVITDNRFPYYVYAGQQDNSTVSVASRTMGGGITERDYYAVGGGESAHVAPHPENPNIVYAGSYSGFLTRYNHATGERRNITVYPDNPMGHGVQDMKYRFQWNFPIEFDPFDSKNFTFLSYHLLFFLINCLIGKESKNSFPINMLGALDISFKFFNHLIFLFFSFCF